jgi:TPR repeat protein
LPRALFNLGSLEDERGNVDQARHWYQQAAATGHTEAISRVQQRLRVLDQRQDERRRGEEFGRYGYLAYADPTLMRPNGQPPTAPDPDQAVDGDKGTVLQAVRKLCLDLYRHCLERLLRHVFGKR